MGKHKRFHRKVYAFKTDFTGLLAKWLVKLSPYTVPDNLSQCIVKFENQLYKLGEWDNAGMLEIDLSSLTDDVYSILSTITDINSLNIPKNPDSRDVEFVFTSRYSSPIPQDDDFIDVMALAQNITCDFADRIDADNWLDANREITYNE